MQNKHFQQNWTKKNPTLLGVCIPFFRLRDKSLHLHECSPFLARYFHYFYKENTMLLFDVDMHILIHKLLESFLFVIGKSNIIFYCLHS